MNFGFFQFGHSVATLLPVSYGYLFRKPFCHFVFLDCRCVAFLFFFGRLKLL